MAVFPVDPADEALLAEALALAEAGATTGDHGPFGAVVARSGVIVGRGWNRVVELRDPTAHAEILAIRDAAARLGTPVLADCTLYSSCEPCPMCLSALYWARIRQVIFAAGREDANAAGFADVRILKEIGRRWEDREMASGRALEEEGRAVLRAWTRNPKRIPY